ncbi:MAG: NAD(P)H-dependent oxidoreductase subunit E [Spirochaetia bacterium]
MPATTELVILDDKAISDDELYSRLDDIIAGFADTEGALIPVLQSVQNLFGYLPEKALKHFSLEMNIPYSEVAGVVTFYSYFSTVPRGKNIIRVCLGTACYVRGGKEVLEAFRKQLDIDVGDTTEDRMFSLEVGRCFGACGLAPVVLVNDDVHQRVKPSKIKELLAPYYIDEEMEAHA